MAEQATFFQENAQFFEGGVWQDDDQRTDIMALIVLDTFPIETINALLDSNKEDCQGAQYLWLADKYENLPDYADGLSAEGTATPVDPEWKSPFIGQSIHEAVDFIRNAPKPPKPLCKAFCAVLQKDRFEKDGVMLICRRVGEEEVQVIPCAASEAGSFFAGFERDEWEESYRRWREGGISL